MVKAIDTHNNYYVNLFVYRKSLQRDKLTDRLNGNLGISDVHRILKREPHGNRRHWLVFRWCSPRGKRRQLLKFLINGTSCTIERLVIAVECRSSEIALKLSYLSHLREFFERYTVKMNVFLIVMRRICRTISHWAVCTLQIYLTLFFHFGAED